MVRFLCVLAVILLIVGFFRGWFSYSVTPPGAGPRSARSTIPRSPSKSVLLP